jgi:tight adherence protein C
MMILSAAALLAVSAGCVAWYFLHLREVKATVSTRMATLPQNLAFPYSFNSTEAAEQSQAGMTLEESFDNKLSRKLYLAGFRSKKAFFQFQWLQRASFAVPGVMMLMSIMTGSLDSSAMMRAGGIGFCLFYLSSGYISGRRTKIVKALSRSLPQILDLLIVSMEAGLNFSSALPRVLKELDPNDPLVKELRVMNHEYLGGLAFSQSCQRLAKRCDLSDLSVIMNAIVESENTGSSLAYVLRVHAHELRDKYRQRLREKAHTLPVKLIFPMMLVFLTIFTIAVGPSAYRLMSSSKEFSGQSEPTSITTGETR